MEAGGRRRASFGVGLLAIAIGLVLMASAATAGSGNFTTPMRMGYPAGDDWEPAVASDGAGNVYVLITHFGPVPGCGGCGDPSMLVQVSHDSGKTFTAPTPLTVNAASQYDPQVKINTAGTVFVSYLLGKDTVVQRSTDHGTTWSAPVAANAGIKNSWTDKDGLAVQGNDVYVGFDIAQKFFVAASHDGGLTFTAVQINGATLGWPLNGGATVAADGTVYMVWELVHKSGNAQGPQDVVVTKSTDRGVTWSLSYADTGLPPGPTCACGWDFLGTGAQIAVDSSGAVYVIYNAPLVDNGPPYVWFRSSSDGGATWSARRMLNADGTAAYHVFPALDAGASGDVRVAWMDNRTGAYNVWYRSSSNGGASWSSDVQVSQYAAGFAYITSVGFAFPYGDYFILDLDASGHVQLAWAEGPSYFGPGNVFYAHT